MNTANFFKEVNGDVDIAIGYSASCLFVQLGWAALLPGLYNALQQVSIVGRWLTHPASDSRDSITAISARRCQVLNRLQRVESLDVHSLANCRAIRRYCKCETTDEMRRT